MKSAMSKAALVAACALAAAPLAFGAEVSEELERRQRDVKGLLRDVAGRMESLAKRIEAGEPEEARRVREAAERVRVSGIDGLLDEIARLISDRNFLEAVGKQDAALKELDEIIALLERAKFRESEGGAQSEANEALRREIERIAGKQERLLRATREHIERKAAKETLRRLAEELSKLEAEQARLNAGDAEAAAASEREDSETLDRASAFVEKLLEAERRIAERAGGLKDRAAEAARGAELAKRLEELADEASRGAEGERPGGERAEGEDAARAAREFVERAEEATRGLSSEPPPPGFEEVRKALEEAAGAANDALRSAEDPKARSRPALERAARSASRAARSLEDAFARDRASLAQEQGLVEKAAREGAKTLAEDGREASTEAAREALSRAGADVERAAGSMEDAAERFSRGESAKAEASRAEAEKDLERAKAALEEGRKALGGRTREEKVSDAERRLARKAEEAGEEVERLEKKLGRKDPERADRLRGAKENLSRAAGSMRESAEAWKAGDSSVAKRKGEESLAKLADARRGLEEVEREEPKPEPLEEKSREQDELARLTRQAGKKVESAPGASPADAKNVDAAADSMEEAGRSLARDEAGAAEKAQEEALERLQKSREALERRAEELARLARERQALSMVEELTKIREEEERIYSGTVDLDARRSKDEGRRQRLLLRQRSAELAESQGTLSERVDALREKLKEELSRVFSFALGNIGSDMRQIRDALKDLEVGPSTQFLERSVLEDLAQLVRALEDEIQRLREAPPGEGMPQGEEGRRLVPLVAELRMLKEMQVDVNRRTRSLEDLREASDGKISEAWERQLDRLLQKQGTVSRLARDLLQDFEKASEGVPKAPPEEE